MFDLLRSVRVVVDGEVRNRPTKSDEIPGHQASVRDNLSRCRRWSFDLMNKFFTSATNRYHEGYEIWYPLPSLPDMDNLVSAQRRAESKRACNDDANVHTDTG